MPEASVRPHHRNVRTVLRRDNLSGSFIASKYRFSPYMACEHGCAYCDGRAEKYYVEGDFAMDIVVRDNTPELLDVELRKLRERGFVSLGSGISDVYQPLEKRELLTRRCAEVLAEHRFPVTVMTKSSLCARDIDLWDRVGERNGFLLIVSLTFSDDSKRAQFEPRASSVEDRVELLRLFKSHGHHVGILAMPLLPGITDSGENVEALYRIATDIDVDFLMPAGLTLRPGRQKEHFMCTLGKSRPDLEGTYAALYRECRQSGVPVDSYSRSLMHRCQTVERSFRIPRLVPHRVYAGRLQRYDEINLLLQHMAELYDARGVDTSALTAGTRRYRTWLLDRKKQYNRRRSLDFDDLDEELRVRMADGRFDEILGNRKLSDFLASVCLEGKLFDYVALTLVD